MLQNFLATVLYINYNKAVQSFALDVKGISTKNERNINQQAQTVSVKAATLYLPA